MKGNERGVVECRFVEWNEINRRNRVERGSKITNFVLRGVILEIRLGICHCVIFLPIFVESEGILCYP